MTLFYKKITDWDLGKEDLCRGRYGVIETRAHQFYAVHLRPWPKLISLRELIPVGDRYHAYGTADRCLLYYNQPRSASNFLALKYIVSTSGTSYRTLVASFKLLEMLAEIKASDALVTDVANQRLSDRFMKRLGWESHKPQKFHRNYIRRYYGTYPEHKFPG